MWAIGFLPVALVVGVWLRHLRTKNKTVMQASSEAASVAIVEGQEVWAEMLATGGHAKVVASHEWSAGRCAMRQPENQLSWECDLERGVAHPATTKTPGPVSHCRRTGGRLPAQGRSTDYTELPE